MRRSRIALVFAAVCTLSAQEDTPTFRSSTRLVQVDVVVKTGDRPLLGLTKEDFQILDNGKPQQIAIFSVRDIRNTPPEIVPLPKGVVANRPQFRGNEPVSATVILLDGVNSYPEDQSFARGQALKYLDGTSRHELVALYALTSTIQVVQDFTTDRDVLKAAIRRWEITRSGKLQDDQDGLLAGLTDNAANAARASNFQGQADSVSSLKVLAQHLRGLPGRKKLIWITSGLPLTFTQENVRNGVVMREFTNQSEQVLAPIKLLNDANVAVYPIDPRGGTICVPRTPPTPCLADPNLTTMIRYAERTGGKPFFIDNDLGAGIDEAFADTDLTYTLGFYPTEEGLNGSEHSISVKVNRRGAELQYRHSYTAEIAGKPLTEKVLKATLSGWVQQPLEATDIPILATAAPAPNKPGYYDVEVAVDVSSLRLEQKNGRFVGSFAVAIAPDVATKPKGLHQVIKVNLTPERMTRALETGIVVINQVRATNDQGKLLSRRLHVVVMDQANGKAGSVRVPITGVAQ